MEEELIENEYAVQCIFNSLAPLNEFLFLFFFFLQNDQQLD